MSQIASFLSESPKGTLLGQAVTNLRNSSQAHMAEEDQMNHCYIVHTLRSERKLIIKCQCHLIPFSTITLQHPPHLIPLLLNLMNLKR